MKIIGFSVDRKYYDNFRSHFCMCFFPLFVCLIFLLQRNRQVYTRTHRCKTDNNKNNNHHIKTLYDQQDRAGKVAWIRQILVALGDWITKVAQTNNR